MKENKALYIAMKKWEQLQLTLNNSKFEGYKAIVRIKHKNCSKPIQSELSNTNFYRFCSAGFVFPSI